MSKSALFAINQNTQNLTDGSTISFGSPIRRFGQNIQLQGNSIEVICQGYFLFNVSVTLAPTAAGTATITLQQNGTIIEGAEASEQVTAADNVINLSFPAIVRNYGYNNASSLNVQLTGVDAAVTNVTTTVVKL